ncbi:MAG: tetratricopeptide repeat protein [Nitrospinales bacterium]
MDPKILDDYRRVREDRGLFFLDDWALISGEGADLLDYLQTQTTNDVTQLAPGTGQNSAIVDRMGKLVASFSIHRDTPGSVLFLIEKIQQKTFLSHLQGYVFREDVRLSSKPQVLLLAIQGPKSILLPQTISGDAILAPKPNDIACRRWEGEEITIINKSLTGEDGFVIALPAAAKEKIISLIAKADPSLCSTAISPEARETLRLEAGLPLFGKDMDNSRILPETGLEHSSVSYNKGCYIGQEVIARVKTYGSPAHALTGLVLEGNQEPDYDAAIHLDTKKIGVIKSSGFSPALGKVIALAYMRKEYRVPGLELNVTIGDSAFQARTALLPFYQTQSRTDRAKQLHTKAMKLYKSEDDLEKPIGLLREAIGLDPKSAQAYEALGVLLSKQDKLDEAIAIMKRLVEIDPAEVMAHSNLSIYYMKQGRIEDAENEKAEATALQFEQLIEQGKTKKAKEKAEQQRREEQESKIAMFKKVLEIDAADQVANFGIGSIYMDTGRYEEALVHLKTLVEHFPDYSAAYLLLGKNLEKLSREKEALQWYEKGIAAASQKGDLMPLKEMQSRQNQLLHSSRS